jgi:hypothetical protein
MKVAWEIDVLKNFKKDFKLNIEEACFATNYIPKHIILDKTRNIHSYVVFGTLENKKLTGTFFSISNNFISDLIELIKVQFSSLDRPLFFLLKNSIGEIMTIEGNLIREFLLNNDSNGVIEYIEEEAIPFEIIANQIKMEL